MDRRRRATADRLQRWLPVGLASLTRFGGGIVMGTALAVFVEARASPFEAGLVGAAFFLGLMLASPAWGAIADVTGRRRLVMAVSGVGATLAVLPLLVVESVWGQIGLRFVYSFFAAGYAPVVLAIVSAYGGDAGRGRSVGVYNSTRAMGYGGGHLLVGVLLGVVVPGQVFLAAAALSALGTVVALFITDPTPTHPGIEWGELAREVRTRLLPAVGDRDHLRRNGLSFLYGAVVLRNVTVLGVMTLMAPFLLREVGVPEALMGLLLAINPVMQVVFMMGFGWVTDSFGRKPLIVAGMAGSGAFGLVAASATLPGGLTARVAVAGGALFLLAASFSALQTGSLAFIGDVSPTGRQSELMGLKDTARGFGGVLGPILLGGLASLFSYQLAFGAASVIALAGTGLVALGLVESRTADGTVRVAADD